MAGTSKILLVGILILILFPLVIFGQTVTWQFTTPSINNWMGASGSPALVTLTADLPQISGSAGTSYYFYYGPGVSSQVKYLTTPDFANWNGPTYAGNVNTAADFAVTQLTNDGSQYNNSIFIVVPTASTSGKTLSTWTFDGSTFSVFPTTLGLNQNILSPALGTYYDANNNLRLFVAYYETSTSLFMWYTYSNGAWLANTALSLISSSAPTGLPTSFTFKIVGTTIPVTYLVWYSSANGGLLFTTLTSKGNIPVWNPSSPPIWSYKSRAGVSSIVYQSSTNPGDYRAFVFSSAIATQSIAYSFLNSFGDWKSGINISYSTANTAATTVTTLSKGVLQLSWFDTSANTVIQVASASTNLDANANAN